MQHPFCEKKTKKTWAMLDIPTFVGSFPNLLQPTSCFVSKGSVMASRLSWFQTKLTETVVTGWMDGCKSQEQKHTILSQKFSHQSLVAGKSTTCTEWGKTPKKKSLLFCNKKEWVFTFLGGKSFCRKLPTCRI